MKGAILMLHSISDLAMAGSWSEDDENNFSEATKVLRKYVLGPKFGSKSHHTYGNSDRITLVRYYNWKTHVIFWGGLFLDFLGIFATLWPTKVALYCI